MQRETIIGAMTDRSGHLLRRRSNDRVIAGVAGGLGDYLNVDPLLIRIAFVGLIIFGGAGLVLYVIGWLLLPAEGHDASILEGLFRRLGLTPRGMAWMGLAIVALIVIQAALSPGGYISLGDSPGGGPRLDGPAWLALVVVGVGFWLLRRRDTAPGVVDVPAAMAPSRAPAAMRPHSPLGWYVVAALLVGIGLLALVSQVAKVEVSPGQFFGAALAVLGIGLVVGAWWGRARILILLALLLLPMAIAANFVTAPLEGGLGEQRFAPANAAELQSEYRMMGGRLLLDLTQLSITAQPIHIAASVAVGQLLVIVPPGASVQVHTRVGAGSAIVFGPREVGTSLDSRFVRLHASGPTYILDLQSGLGEVEIISQATLGN